MNVSDLSKNKSLTNPTGAELSLEILKSQFNLGDIEKFWALIEEEIGELFSITSRTLIIWLPLFIDYGY